MAKRFHHVTLELFVRGEEKVEAVLSLLDPLLPVPSSTFFEAQFRWDPEREHTQIYALKKELAELIIQEAKGFEDTITVVTLFFGKAKHANNVFDAIISRLSEKDRHALKAGLLSYVDAQGRLQIRINKDGLNKHVSLAAGGDCIKLLFAIAAYPKNAHAIREVARAIAGGIA